MKQTVTQKTNDLDDVFKLLKNNHTDLFISIINDSFGMHYTKEDKAVLLPTEGYILTGKEPPEIEKRFSDFLLKLGGETYLIECQSYSDNTMAIRIAEYAFLSARSNAIWENGRCIIEMPRFVIIYVKSNASTPEKTEISFRFPDGDTIQYDCRNVILSDYSKEEIVRKKLYAYIPYYIMWYEKDITTENTNALAQIEEDIRYFLSELENAFICGELEQYDVSNLKDYMKIIIRHITNGNTIEERLVSAMCGNIIVTEADKIRAAGLSEGIHTLSKAVQTARRNHYTSVEELVAAGFDETIAQAAIELL